MSVTGKAPKAQPQRDSIGRAGVVAWSLLGVLLLMGVVLWILALLRDIFPPLALAIILIFLLNPMVTGLQRRGVRRGIGTAAIYLVFIFIVMIAVSFLAPPLGRQVNELVDRLPEIRKDTVASADRLLARVGLSLEDVGLGPLITGFEGTEGESATPATEEEIPATAEPTPPAAAVVPASVDPGAPSGAEVPPPAAEASPEPLPSPSPEPSPSASLAASPSPSPGAETGGGLPSFLEELGSRLFAGAGRFATGALHVVLNFILAPVFAAYLLIDLPKIQKAFLHYLPPRYKDEWLPLFERSGNAVGSFFRGQLLVAAIVGAMSCLAFLIVDLPFWLPIGLLAGFFNIIPLVGPFVGGGVAVLVGGFTAGPALAVKAALAMLVVQQIDNHFISPKVMGWAVRLHPVAVMVALIVGLSLGGMLGMLLAVPALGVMKIVVVHYYETRVLGNWDYHKQSSLGGLVKEAGEKSELPPEPGDSKIEGLEDPKNEAKSEAKTEAKTEAKEAPKPPAKPAK